MSQKLEVKEGKTFNFGSHKEKLGVNDSQTSTNGSLKYDNKITKSANLCYKVMTINQNIQVFSG